MNYTWGSFQGELYAGVMSLCHFPIVYAYYSILKNIRKFFSGQLFMGQGEFSRSNFPWRGIEFPVWFEK